ncbi:pilus assembly protein TadG-related protein [Mesorhizobium sp. M1396]|uniref:pilus assembly protein TadG-related protein n=1 Tax=Mesorhizobium sp. M1396 TaxID=2957095 RepID=UPI00333BE505
MLGTIRAFWNDQRGVAMILVAIMLPVIIGFALLVIDMSRANSLHNDLQKGADAFALAAAAELDGKSDAITRSNNALATLVFNTYRFADQAAGDPPGATTLAAAGVTWRYLSSLPVNDSDPITVANVTTDATDARFVEVTVTPVGFSAMFPASFVGGVNGFNIGSVSVAGFNSAVCDFTPMFICNPYEDPTAGITLEEAVASTDYRRRLIQLRKIGNGAALAGPGNFGFLDPPVGIGHGANGLAETIATSVPKGCYASGTADTKTGQNAGPVEDAFNVRFSIDPGGNKFNTAEYGPARNVRKGAIKTGKGNNCPKLTDLDFTKPGTMGMPRDQTFPYMSGRMGDGNWDLTGYWNTNFGTSPTATKPAGWAVTKPTRYEVYREELRQNIQATPSTGGEIGTPPNSCLPQITTVDRRILYVSIVDCNRLEDEGYDLNGNSTDIPVRAFGSFFLTEPVRSSASTSASVMVELVDITGAGGRGSLQDFVRDEPQLYR